MSTFQIDPRRARPWPGIRWDHGITWVSRRTVEPTTLPVDVSYVQDRVLRLADLDAEYDYVESLIRASTQAAEDRTQRALTPQTWQMVLSGFPCSGRIVLERPPLVSVTSVAYYDRAGDAQELAVSPAEFLTVPSGAYSKAEIRPLAGETWPSTATRPDAVTVTYRCGYEEPTAEYELIKVGIGLMVGELYKQRTLSVHAVHNTPSVLQLERFWRPVL